MAAAQNVYERIMETCSAPSIFITWRNSISIGKDSFYNGELRRYKKHPCHIYHFETGHASHGGNRDSLIRTARAAGWTGDDESFIDASVNLNPLGPPTCCKKFYCPLMILFWCIRIRPMGIWWGRRLITITMVLSTMSGNGADELIFALARMLVKSWGNHTR